MKYPKVIFPRGLLALRIVHELSKRSLCGDDLASLIGLRKGSKLTPGTIYPALKFLKKKKLITMRRNGRKKIYTLTPDGKKECAAAKKEFIGMYGGMFKK